MFSIATSNGKVIPDAKGKPVSARITFHAFCFVSNSETMAVMLESSYFFRRLTGRLTSFGRPYRSRTCDTLIKSRGTKVFRIGKS
jgi:hypothetical protein